MTWLRGASTRARAVLFGLVLASALGASACGVPLDEAARPVLSTEMNPLLLPADPTLLESTAEVADPADRQSVTVKVFFLGGDGRLVPVSRDAEPTPSGILDALLAGPSDAEIERGLRTALGDVKIDMVDFSILEDPDATPDATPEAEPTDGPDLAETDGSDDENETGDEIIDAEATGPKSLLIKLTDDSFSLRPVRNEQVAAFAQMVYTLTERDDVALVAFTRDGEGWTIPSDRGAFAPGIALDRSSFASFAPRPLVGFADETGRRPSNVSVYFVNQVTDKLQPVGRTIETTPQPLIDNLFIGPSVTEFDVGLRSKITGQARAVIDVQPEVQTARIDLTLGSLPDSNEPELRELAIAQIVYTITELPDVTIVLISEGELAITTGRNGEREDLTRDDYENLLAVRP